MKKKISRTLAFTLLASNINSLAFANELDVIRDINNVDIIENNISKTSPSTISDANQTTGSIEVDINFSLPIKYTNVSETNMKVTLINSQGQETTVELGNDNLSGSKNNIDYTLEAFNGKRQALDSENVSFYKLTLNNLEKGSYTVSVSGAGYQTLTTNVEIDKTSKRISFGNTEKVFKLDDKNIVYPGAFLAGDVNNDSKINLDDYNAVKNDINSKSNNSNYDLNRDGKVNITDLTFVHQNIDKNAKNADITDTNQIIDVSKITLASDSSKITNGEVKDLFVKTTQNTVTFQSDSTISEDTPMDIALDLGEPVMMEQVSLTVPNNDNAPQKGYIVVNGEKYPFENVSTYARSSQESVIKVNLGKQVAVSQITIQVTGSRSNTNLTEIAKVEFLNNVYDELPKPNMNIPVINYVTTKTQTGKEELVLGWDHQPNVEAYQIKLQKVDSNGNVLSTQYFKTKENTITIPKVEAYATYRASIQSLNGEWQSGYKDEQDDYKLDKVGATNLETNTNDKDGKPDNVDKNYIQQAWNSVTGKLEQKASSSVSNSYEGLSGANNYGQDSIIEIQVIPESKPEGPHGITITGGYRALEVNWKNHAKSKEFDLYYREKGTKQWFKANDPNYVDSNVNNDIPDNYTSTDSTKLIKDKTSYKIEGLKDKTTYEIIMSATNHHGTGELSEIYEGTTENILPPQMPNYKLINTSSDGDLTSHIVDVKFNIQDNKYVGDAKSIVDGNYETAWKIQDWDGGVHYGNRMPVVVFDDEYEIDTIRFATMLENTSLNTLPHEAKVRVLDDNGNEIKVLGREQITVKHLKGENGQNYVELVLDEPVKAKNIEVNLAVYGGKNVSVSEMKFYNYDSLQNETKNLFNDDLQLTLKSDVTTQKIEILKTRANTVDSISNEYHPYKDDVLAQLLRAEQILADKNLDDELITIDPEISNQWGGYNLGQTNDWQALGVAVRPGDKLNIFIGKDGFQNTTFELGISQHFGESNTAMTTYSQELRVGKNEITIPESAFDMDFEKGGSLYIRFKNRNFSANENIKVRISGGEEIPHLNVNNVLKTSEAQAKVLIGNYIDELEKYVTELPNKYKDSNLDYGYNEETSILNATEIETDNVMLSLPATQILNGIKENLTDKTAMIDRVYKTLLAWEQLMDVSFLQQGIITDAIDFNNNKKIDAEETTFYNNNKRGKNRMNIKYQRMFPGAFMYASGHHVGIGFGSTPEMMQGVPFEFDANGNVTNADEANLFGWGIGHEIGHVHDINGLTYAETTNNILALITQTFDDIDASRIEGSYDKVYKRVTSQGEFTPQGIVGLAMFWQLHLAYDNDNTYDMLKVNTDNNLENDTFYAKLYRVTREKGIAPQETGFDRTAQTFIMRASDAVKKDLREFFSRWGITASPKTNAYLDSKGYEKEDKAIFYLNDEARRKRLEATDTSSLTMATNTKVTGKFTNGIQDNSYVTKKEVTFEFDVDKDDEKILGYELIRKEIDGNGGFKEVPVGFVERDANNDKTAYTDIIDTANNRVYEYKVVAYDYNLNKTEESVIGTVKVKHDGSLAKDNFSFDTNTRGVDDKVDESTGHGQVEDGSINKIKDNKADTVYNATKVPSCDGHDHSGDAYVTVDLGNNRQIVGLKYTAPKTTTEGINKITDYEVYVSDDNKTWQKAHSGKFTADENTIYFNESGTSENSQLWAYNARYVKIVSKGQSTLSIAELDIIGPPGDNIEIGLDSTNSNKYANGVGILNSDYVYDNNGSTIPAGSLVVMGEFRGNPAYNVPLVLNENGENFALKSKSILLAEIPSSGKVGEISQGTYIYWVAPEDLEKVTIDGKEQDNLQGTKVKSVLYRYNKLNESGSPVGQRLVSDSMYKEIDINNLQSLPKIDLNSELPKTRSLTNNVYEVNQNVLDNINN